MGKKGGLDVIIMIIHFKTPVLSGKLEYSRKLRRYFGWDGRVFGGVSAGTEELLEVSRPGRKSFFRYLGRDGGVFMMYLGRDGRVF